MGQRENHFARKEKVYGQFFTPPSVADFIVKFSLRFLEKRERAIDPACGDGVFLASLLNAGFSEVWGIDIDPNVLSLIPPNVKEKAKILIMDALIRGGLLGANIPENYFDLVVGNPPFSAKYGRVSDTRLLYYELGKDRSSQAIEVLFLERFIQLAREGGVIGIILPEGVFANKSMTDVREFILRYKVLAVVSLPRGVFRGSMSTSSKTHILFLKKVPNDGSDALMIEINSLTELKEDLDKLAKKGVLARPVTENLTPSYYANRDHELRFKEGFEVKTLGELTVIKLREKKHQSNRSLALDSGLYKMYFFIANLYLYLSSVLTHLSVRVHLHLQSASTSAQLILTLHSCTLPSPQVSSVQW